MAGPSPEEIIQNIVIKFTEVLEQQTDVIRHLSNLQRQTNRATDSVQKHTKAISLMGKMANTSFARLNALGGAINKTFKGALGSAATTMGVIIGSIKNVSQSFLQLELTSAGAGHAVARLRSVYKGLQAGNDHLSVSMKGVSDSLIKFQTDINRKFMVASNDAVDGLSRLTSAVVQSGVSKDKADEMLSPLFESLDNYRPLLNNLLKDLAGADFKTPKGIIAMREALNSVNVLDATEAVFSVQQILTAAAEQMDKLVTPEQRLSRATENLGTVFENVQKEIVDTFGEPVAKVLEELSQWIGREVPKAVETARQKFEAWGGAERVIDEVKAGIQSLIKTAKNLWASIVSGAESAKPYIQWFIDKAKWLYDKFPKLTIGATAFMAVFGFRNTFSAVWDLVRATGLLSTNFNAATTAARGFSSVVAGARGAIGGIGGHVAGKAGARALGADEYGGAEALAGMGGAFAAGTAMGGPVAGTVAAVGSAGVSTYQAWEETKRVLNESNDALNKNIELADKNLAQLRDSATKMVTPYQEAGRKTTELQLQLIDFKHQLENTSIWNWREQDRIIAEIEETTSKLAAARAEKEKLAKTSAFATGAKLDPKAQESINKLQEDLKKKQDELLFATQETVGARRQEVEALKKQISEASSLAQFDAERKNILDKIKESQDAAAADPSKKEAAQQVVATLRDRLDKMDKAKADTEAKKLAEVKAEIEKTTKKTEQATSSAVKFKKALGDWQQTVTIADQLSQSMGSLNKVLMGMGPAAMSGGKQVADILSGTVQESLDKAKSAFDEADRLARLARTEKNPTRAAGFKKEAAAALATAYELQETALQNVGVLEDSRIKRIQQTRDVLSAEMRMSEAMFGTADLAVQKRLEMVKTLTAESGEIQTQLDKYQQLLDVQEKQLQIAQKSGAETGSIESNIFQIKGKILEKAKELRSVQADQLEQVRDLRDGYLDAVQAQAFGAGRFQKILITQDQNIAKGLEKDIAKKSFLLGQTGAAADRSNVQSSRFSATGMGQMESGGNLMSQADVANKNRELIKNISDETSRIQAEESQKMLGGIFSSFEQTSNLSVDAYNRNTQSTDRLTETINSKALATAGVGIGASGGPAADALMGEAARKAMGNNPSSAQKMFQGLLGGTKKAISGLFGSGGGGSGGGGNANHAKELQNIPGILTAMDYKRGKPTRLSKAQADLDRANKRLIGFKGVNKPYNDANGFDMRSAGEISKDRAKNKKEIDRLTATRNKAAIRLAKEQERAMRGHTDVAGPGQPTTEGVGKNLPKTSLSNVTEYGNKKGTNKNIKLGSPPSAQDWTAKLKYVAAALMGLGPLIDELRSNDDTDSMRPTRPGGRTALGGPGS